MLFKLSWPKGRFENPEGVGQVVIQGPFDLEGFSYISGKIWRAIDPLGPLVPTTLHYLVNVKLTAGRWGGAVLLLCG